MFADRVRLLFSAPFIVLSGQHAAFAQTASPNTVTPPSLAPERNDREFRVEIPEAGALTPPAGADRLSITLANVRVDGGFDAVAADTNDAVAKITGRKTTLADIYAAASAIEAAHARAGFILARVSVPPQELRDGGTLRIVVTDGFVEAVDTTGLPDRVRPAIEARTRGLIGKRRVTLSQIEEPLLLANAVPGLELSSTLVRGEQPGGTRIVLTGRQRVVTGQVAVDNSFDPALGRWGVSAQVALNGLLGAGEQIYGFSASDYDISNFFSDSSRVRVLGVGIIVPLGDGRFSINSEYTASRTAPSPRPTAPATVGKLERISLRGTYIIEQRRNRALSVTAGVERIGQTNDVPLFGVRISRDAYLAARLGASLSTRSASGSSVGGSVQLSQGLGELAGRSLVRAQTTGVPYSRQGARNGFTKLSAQAAANWSLGNIFDVAVSAKAQTSFGNPLLRAEQFALEGRDAVSGYVGGETAVDEGVALRTELIANVPLGPRGAPVLAPMFLARRG